MIDARFQVLDFVVAPVGKNRARIFLAAAGTAAIVYCQDCVAVGGEKLALEANRMLVLSVWATVNAQQQRDLRSFRITNRISQQAVHFRSIFALETDIFSFSKPKLIQERVVLMS